MIIVKLQGGLGNQMFQYAFGRNLALTYKAPLKFDLSTYTHGGFRGDTPRQYVLHNFNIKAEIATHDETARFRWIAGNRFLKKTARILQKVGLGRISHYVAEQGQWYHSGISYQPPVTYFAGYWQSEKYFKDIEPTIRQEFTLSHPATAGYERYAQMIGRARSASVHIRRTDFITNSNAARDFGLPDLAYYKKAMALIEQKFPEVHFFVFSDDIAWAEANLKTSRPITYVSKDNLPDYEELLLMSLCQHNILSNSSFSWWGAWLNTNPEKIVIRPKQWFLNPTFVTKDLLLDSWIAL